METGNNAMLRQELEQELERQSEQLREIVETLGLEFDNPDSAGSIAQREDNDNG